MKLQELQSTWETLAHKVLASILVDHGAVFPVMDVLGQGVHWFPKRQAQVWVAILQCVEEGMPPTIEAVATRGADAGYTQSIANQWDDESNRNVVYHAEELRRIGALMELRKVGKEILQVTAPSDVLAGVEYATNRLSGVLAATTRRKGDAKSVSQSAWDRLEQFSNSAAISTGLDWFDKVAGGLWTGMNYWIVAPYKHFKTSLMRNIILHVLAHGHAVDVYCAEGSREMFTLDCQAMIATRLLCELGIPHKDLRLSGLFLLHRWRNNDAVFIKQELDAVRAARGIWEKYNVRVWDTADGIRNLAVFRNRVQKSKFDHGSLIHWADYSQLFGGGGTIYERQSTTALAVQTIATNENVMVGMLAQRNESSIISGSGYSAGVKGGGDASAAADFMLTSQIDKTVPDVVNVQLKFSRHTGLCGGNHVVNPSSGLILDKWVRRVDDDASINF